MRPCTVEGPRALGDGRDQWLWRNKDAGHSVSLAASAA